MLGRARTDRSARTSARSRLSRKGNISTGLRAAAAGGFTAVAAMANTSPVNDKPADHALHARARSRGALGAAGAGFGGHARAARNSSWSISPRWLRRARDCFPTTEFRSTIAMVLSRALDETKRLGYAVSLHEEDRALSCDGALNAGAVSKRLGVSGYPDSAESQRVRRDLALAIGSGARFTSRHVSTAESLELIRAARRHGAQVTCEVTPHHFTLDESAALTGAEREDESSAAQSRRRRSAARRDSRRHDRHDRDRSRAARSRSRSRWISSARCFGPGHPAPQLDHDSAEEFAHAANGVVGLETALGLALELVHRSLIEPARLVEMMSLNPARCCGWRRARLRSARSRTSR